MEFSQDVKFVMTLDRIAISGEGILSGFGIRLSDGSVIKLPPEIAEPIIRDCLAAWARRSV